MKSATVREIKNELSQHERPELLELCLRLSKFKKENKELLTYLLFYDSNEADYIDEVKKEMTEQFKLINTSTYYFIRKSVRKILRNTKKYIRYSGIKETEVALLLFFCHELKKMSPTYTANTTLTNLFNRQLGLVKKAMLNLHEDLQYDYQLELEELDEGQSDS